MCFINKCTINNFQKEKIYIKSSVDDDVVGLFVSSVPEEEVDENACASYMQELYIVPEYRRRGIAKGIFTGFIKRQKQDTGFCIVEESPSGKYFINITLI